jgi:aspartyl-tRNA(Asn)/glutamyl-tRNA(Gln) amidotransferase subunit B
VKFGTRKKMDYEVVIGLEIHAQLKTKSKLFCSCEVVFGGAPNTKACPVCLGMPGVLPVINKTAVEYAVRMGLATGSRIKQHSAFERKNYFYPDLPKGFQISQYQEPLCVQGSIEIEVQDRKKKIGITRIHMEEDPCKLIHDRHEMTLIDSNRSGTPLIEIVSEPDMRSAQEAFLYLTKLKQLLQYMDVCDGNMEEGSLRCDANVSLRPLGQSTLGTKTELKNMNSFHNVEKALEFEIKRQLDVLSQGGKIVQETLRWDPSANRTKQMRTKESAHDYRYFPEPDLLPLIVEDEWIREIKENLPELPDARRERFISEYSLKPYDADVITTSRDLADYFENCVKEGADPVQGARWVMGDILRIINEEKLDSVNQVKIKPGQLAEMIKLQAGGTISGKIAKTVFEDMAESGKDPGGIVKEKGLVQITDDSEIEPVIQAILDKNAKEVAAYREGKDKLMGFFVGQVMKETKGKANPKIVNQILLKKLKG